MGIWSKQEATVMVWKVWKNFINKYIELAGDYNEQ